MANKIDSNVTGLRFAEESAVLGVLPGSPVWYPLEPNSYDDFGGSVATIARNPINSGRQRKKGVVTDLDAAGGFNSDLTQVNLKRLLQGFMFADLGEKGTTDPINGTLEVITAVDTTADEYSAAAGMDAFAAGDIVFAAGFTDAANNGIKVVTGVTAATDIAVAENLVTETPPATASIKIVGFEGIAGDIDVDSTGSLPALTSTTADFTTMGLVPGEWIYIGGDVASLAFATAANNGFARVNSILANRLEFDKTDGTMVTEASTTETVQLFFGDRIKNESLLANQVRRSYQLERTLGDNGTGEQSEYLVGAVPGEFTLNVSQADKITIDLSFVAIDNEQNDGGTGVKTGLRPVAVEAAAFNTSSDFSRTRLSLVSAVDSNPAPLFAFVTDFTIGINNNVSPNKAVGVLGAFDVSAGTFEVGGSMTAYFADIAATAAVRDNADVTQDFAVAKDNAGILFDIGLIALGDGRASVEQDQAITLPLEVAAGVNKFDQTLLVMFFDYLPTAAE